MMAIDDFAAIVKRHVCNIDAVVPINKASRGSYGIKDMAIARHPCRACWVCL